MGHILLGDLPKTRAWNDVVELLRVGATIEELAGATAIAAEKELQKAAADPGFAYTVWLLTQLPQAAKSSNFRARLEELGFNAASAGSVLDLAGSFSAAVGNHVAQNDKANDLGILARQAAAETITAFLTSGTASLFDTEAETLQKDLAALGTKTNFASLAREFFGRLTQKTLEYYISRALPDHIGSGKPIRTIDDQIDFRIALEKHCREASLIVEEFAGGWYSKKDYQGTLTPEAAKGFGQYALKKMRDELRARRGADA
ncbi:MAG: hypothetical protein AAFR90_14735 [Pseudomonadota bacterium]